MLMNILQVSDVSISNVIGGGERVLFEQGQRLAKRGHRIVNLTRLLPEHQSAHETIGAVHEFRYSVDRRNPVTFLISTLFNAKRLFESLSNRYHFSSIHFHQPFSAFAVSRSPLARKIQKVYICHSLAFEEYQSRNRKPGGIGAIGYGLNVIVRKKMEQQALDQSDTVCVLSDYTRSKVTKTHGISKKKIKIVPGGVDLNLFRPAVEKQRIRRQLRLPEDRLILLTVRNLVPRMGLENLIRAFDQLRRTVPDAYLVIGGTGPLHSPLAEMMGRLELSEHMTLYGFIPDELLPQYYCMADLFVLPTQELEGFGLVTVESLACGVPVVGTPIGGTKEILGSFDPEFLFDNPSLEAIAKKIIEKCKTIKENPGKWAETGRQCRTFVEENYSWERNIDALEKLMHRMI
jgi:glycosyltransferase involved in cell wall biosynthesis